MLQSQSANNYLLTTLERLSNWTVAYHVGSRRQHLFVVFSLCFKLTVFE